MEDKKKFLEDSLPKAALQALTPQAADAVPQDRLENDCIVIKTLPFKIGRESRLIRVKGRLQRAERPKIGKSKPNNDIYLVDSGHRLNISREHLLIERQGDQYFLVDRGSACGTKLEGTTIGGEDSGGSAPLHDGDVIAVGSAGTPYVYRFISFDEYEVAEKIS